MKVALVIPTHHYATQYPSPLSVSDVPAGFGYLAAVLKAAGHETIGVNPNNITGYATAQFMLVDILGKKLREAKPDVVCVGGICTDYLFLRDAINITRSVSRDIPIVLGGQIVTNDADFIVGDLQPDYAVVGEGEDAILKIVRGEIKPHSIVETQPARRDLDSLPFPDYEPFGVRDMLDHHSHDTRLLYRYSRPDARPFNIVASRSCPFHCTFCIDESHKRSPYRARSVSNIMAEIRETYERYRYNVLIILDELFVAKNERFEEFCLAILDNKAKHGWDFDWVFQTHASAKLTLQNLKLAKRAGCYLFSYGLESAAPEVLESMQKKIIPEQVAGAIELARQADIGFSANLIFGDPAETEATWAESLRFWLQYGRDNFIFLAMLMPYPGSRVFEVCRERGLFADKRAYYETIDRVLTNMTRIPDRTFGELVKVIAKLERDWLFVRSSRGQVQADGLFHGITAVCPHCGAESSYRERIPEPGKPFTLGTGCQKCHRRIRVDCSP